MSMDALYCDAPMLIHDLPSDYVQSTSRCCDDVRKKGVLSCRQPDRDDYVREGKGYDLNNKAIKNVSEALPIYIPILGNGVKKLPLSVDHPYVGVRLRDLFPNAVRVRHGVPEFIESSPIDLNLLGSGFFGEGKKLLFYSDKDLLIEGINKKSYKQPIYNDLKRAGVDITTTPDFSVNEGSCVFGQVVNTNRTLAVGEKMSNEGLLVIPNMFAIHTCLVEMWVNYLNKNTHIKYVSINCQRQNSQCDREKLIWYIHEVLSKVDRPVHVILHGYPIRNKKYLKALRGLAAQIHFADSAPYCYATQRFTFFIYDSKTKELVLKDAGDEGRSPEEKSKMIIQSISAVEEYLKENFYTYSLCSPLNMCVLTTEEVS